MNQSAQNAPYGGIYPPPQLATNSVETNNYNNYQQPMNFNAGNNAQMNYISAAILPSESISGLPVCKSQLPDGSFELTFGGTIPAPPAIIPKRTKADYIMRMIRALNIPDSMVIKPSGSMIRVSSVEFLTYGNLTINTQNYRSFPQKINCCIACCNPPVFINGRISLCLLNIMFFLYFVPVIISSITFARIATIYNLYMSRVHVAAENIKKNGGVYVPDEPAALATINRLRNTAALAAPGMMATGIVATTQMPQYQAPQFNPPPAPTYPTDNNYPKETDVDPVLDKREEEFLNPPQYSTVMPL